MTASDAPSRDTRGGAEPTVLIVDDEAATRTLLKKTVQRLSMPCKILEAADGDSALRIVKQSQPDLVLLDIVLPGSTTSGVLLCQQFCKDFRTKVVVVSGKATDSIAQACLAMGAAAIVRKPFSVDEVRQELEQVLAS